MAKIKYMTKRKGSDVWQLYIRVPDDVQKEYGKKFERESLGETDKRKAELKKDIRVAEIKSKWERIRASKGGVYIPTDEEFESWVIESTPGPRYDQQFLDTHFLCEEPRPTIAELKQEIREADDRIKGFVERTLSYIDHNVSSEVKTKLYQSAKTRYLQRLRSEMNENLGVEPLSHNQDSGLTSASGSVEEWNIGAERPITVFEAVSLYKESSDWKDLKPSTYKDYKRALSILVRCFDASQTLGSLKPSDYDRINQVFHYLPKGLPDKGSLDALINANSKKGLLAPNSKNKYISSVKSFFEWAEKNTFIAKNFADLYLKHAKVKKVVNPLPLSDEDVKVLFSNIKHDYACWISLIGLFTGMRRNEVCQLSPEDVIEYQGVWSFYVNEEADEKSIKREGSHRIVPIHSFLRDLGFVEFVKKQNNQNGRIFAELTFTDSDNWSSKFASKFDRQMDELGLKPKNEVDRKSFHGFRYAMTDHLFEHGIDEGVIDAILGWSTEERKELMKAMRIHYSGRTRPQVPIKLLQAAIETRKFDWLETSRFSMLEQPN